MLVGAVEIEISQAPPDSAIAKVDCAEDNSAMGGRSGDPNLLLGSENP